MDTEIPEADQARIREIVLAHPEMLDIHGMRTRSSGPYAFIQLHNEIDRDLTLVAAHEFSDQVM